MIFSLPPPKLSATKFYPVLDGDREINTLGNYAYVENKVPKINPLENNFIIDLLKIREIDWWFRQKDKDMKCFSFVTERIDELTNENEVSNCYFDWIIRAGSKLLILDTKNLNQARADREKLSSLREFINKNPKCVDDETNEIINIDGGLVLRDNKNKEWVIKTGDARDSVKLPDILCRSHKK